MVSNTGRLPAPARHCGSVRRAVWALPLAALGIAWSAAGCERSPSAPEAELSFQTLAKNTVTGNFGPQIREVVRDRARFEAIWTELGAGRETAAPPIDFDREMVVAASGALVCFDVVEIERITLEGNQIVVELTEATNTSLCSCGGAQSTFHIVRLRRLAVGARFAARPVPPSCPG